MGQVVGATCRKRGSPIQSPVNPQDLLATIYRVLGITQAGNSRTSVAAQSPSFPSANRFRNSAKLESISGSGHTWNVRSSEFSSTHLLGSRRRGILASPKSPFVVLISRNICYRCPDDPLRKFSQFNFFVTSFGQPGNLSICR